MSRRDTRSEAAARLRAAEENRVKARARGTREAAAAAIAEQVEAEIAAADEHDVAELRERRRRAGRFGSRRLA